MGSEAREMVAIKEVPALRKVTFKKLWRLAVTVVYWRGRFKSIGRRSILYRPILVMNPKFISIGDRVFIRENARLEALYRHDVSWVPELKLANGVTIEQGFHTVCQGSIDIGENVAIGPYCVVVDTRHPHDPPDTLPRMGERLPRERSFVKVGAGSMIGGHVVILPNVEIGKCCVIGAGSIVTKSIPDYSVAMGNPARVVKVFDVSNREWVKPWAGAGNK